MPRLEYCTFVHPRRSSDYSLRATDSADGAGAAVYAVADMIGKPRGLKWRNYMRTLEALLTRHLKSAAFSSMDDVNAWLIGELTRHCEIISQIRTTHDRDAFGFCLALAAAFGERLRIHWLGDCRAYHLSRRCDPAGQPAFTARCLTRDFNELGRLLDERRELRLFRRDLMALGKRLHSFLGHPDLPAIRDLLLRQTETVVLRPDEAVVMMTDGFYLPQVRKNLEHTADILTPATFYLESELQRQLAEIDSRLPAQTYDYWPEVFTYLIDQACQAAHEQKAYRDDIAVMAVYRLA